MRETLVTSKNSALRQDSSSCQSAVFYTISCIHLHHLLAPFPFWRPVVPLSVAVALLRCVSLPLARMKNSLRILVHFHLEIVFLIPPISDTAPTASAARRSTGSCRSSAASPSASAVPRTASATCPPFRCHWRCSPPRSPP